MPTQRLLEASSDWMSVQQSMAYCNVSRSRLYKLITETDIRTVCIKRRGRMKGNRYLSRASLDNYFASQCDIQMINEE
jgi:Helix-turn-helix domain